MLNIISNAVKFTKTGCIQIKCSVLHLKRVVIVSISDTGIGIAETEQGKLFNDFQMVKGNSVDNAMGSGLGLSICESLASSMNIKISATSTFGKGSEFSLAIQYLADSPLLGPSTNLGLKNNEKIKQKDNNLLYDINEMNVYKKCPCDVSSHVRNDLKNEGLFEEFSKNDDEVKFN